MAGVILNRLDIFGGAARLIKMDALTPQPTKLEDIIQTGAEPGDARGTLQAGWDDIGATDDGVTMTVGYEGEDWEVDQSRFPIKTQITAGSYVIETNLAEASLETLQFGWELTDITSTAAVSGTNVCQRSVPLGIPGSFTERMIAFIVERQEYDSSTMRYRAYVFYIAARDTEDSEHAYTKNDKVLVPITFKARPDICKDDDECIGIILDECIAEMPPC